MADTTEIAITAEEVAVATPKNCSTSMWFDEAKFNQIARASSMLSKTTIIPEAYRDKPGDCAIVLDIAYRTNTNPLFVMQNMNVVHGKPSWTGQACMSLIKSYGEFYDVKYEYTGEKGKDNRGCYVTATRKSDGKRVDGTEVTMAMAKAERWVERNTKWRTMPEQMLGYRAASFFARMHCPDALMGIQTAEEVYETVDEKTNKLNNALKEDK